MIKVSMAARAEMGKLGTHGPRMRLALAALLLLDMMVVEDETGQRE